jgi:hypothetical protein
LKRNFFSSPNTKFSKLKVCGFLPPQDENSSSNDDDEVDGLNHGKNGRFFNGLKSSEHDQPGNRATTSTTVSNNHLALITTTMIPTIVWMSGRVYANCLALVT